MVFLRQLNVVTHAIADVPTQYTHDHYTLIIVAVVSIVCVSILPDYLYKTVFYPNDYRSDNVAQNC